MNAEIFQRMNEMADRLFSGQQWKSWAIIFKLSGNSQHHEQQSNYAVSFWRMQCYLMKCNSKTKTKKYRIKLTQKRINTDLLREGVGAASHILLWSLLFDASSEDIFSVLYEVSTCNSSWNKSVGSEEGLQESSSLHNFPSFSTEVLGSFRLLVVISKLDMSTAA